MVVLISAVLLTFGHGAFAQNVLQVTCDGNFSPIQTLCRDGNNCNNIGGLINPGPASNSGQDNVFFVTAPPGQVVDVTWEVEQIDITSSQGVQSDDAIELDFSGPATIPATPQTIDDDTPFPPPFAHTYTQSGVSTPPPVQISIGPTAPGPGSTFQVAQYRVKCTPSANPGQATLTLKKDVINDNGGTAVDTDFTLTFTGPDTGSGPETDSAVTGVTVPAGSYALSETGPAGYDLTAINCTGGADANGLDGLTLADGEDVTCTFVNDDKKDDKPGDETKRFIHRRVDNLLSHDPDRARMLRRLGEQERPQSLKDGPLKFSGEHPVGYQVSTGGTTASSGGMMGFGSPMALGANPKVGDDDRLPWVRGPFDSDYESTFGYGATQGSNTNLLFASFANQLAPLVNGATSFKFGTSLSELRSKAAEAEASAQQKKLEEAGLSFAGQPYLWPTTTLRQGLDVWVEGHISRYSDDIGGINRDGDFRILYIGADYVLAPHILVGALVQIDDTNEDLDDPTQTGEIDGTGWMVGPYAGVKLLDNLFFDARAAWGQSDNDIWLNDQVNGFRSGSFDTERWLATATLTGVHYHGAWRFSPQVGLAYGHESFDTYITSLGQIVAGDDANIGRLTGGVEVGYRMQARYGMIVEPHVALNGIWNFDSDDLFINGVLTETEETRAEVEGGIMVTTASGWAFRAAGRYDGIGGDDFEAYGGSLWVNVPLH